MSPVTGALVPVVAAVATIAVLAVAVAAVRARRAARRAARWLHQKREWKRFCAAHPEIAAAVGTPGGTDA